MIESAIPNHLQQERSQTAATPSEDYIPPYPSFSARFSTDAKDLVMAVIGVQYPTTTDAQDGRSGGSRLVQFVTSDAAKSPLFWEMASVTDNVGAYNLAIIAYWPSKALFSEWEENSGFKKWWDELENDVEHNNGWFMEVFFPSIERFETLFTDNEVPEGAANMRQEMSGMVKEHGYWGSMRDRLPLSQTDELAGEKWNPITTSKGVAQPAVPRRVSIQGKQNLAIIRSGQDWSNTSPKERKLYLETMHPVLIKGMEFLRDSGAEVGCYSCRLMEVVDTDSHTADKDRTFGLAYFDSLASLEGWSKQHKTHLAIFGRFMQYAKELGPEMSLRAWHEVMVVTSDQQRFEYIGCHAGTGMMSSLLTTRTEAP